MGHLFFTKMEKPSRDRRERGGFPPDSDRKNNIQYGEKLLSQVRNHVTENIDDIQKFRFEPHLVMEVGLEKDVIPSEANISKLGSMGLKVVGTEEKKLMVLFTDDYELEGFNRAIDDYKQGIIAKTKIKNGDLFPLIRSVLRWNQEDRKGQGIEQLSEIDYIGCYLWIFDSLNETKNKAEEFIRNAERNCVKCCNKYISQTVAVIRLKMQEKQLLYFLKHPLIYRVGRIPNYHVKRAERATISDIALSNIKYSRGLLTEGSASICVIDSGILSEYPLLKDAIGDAKAFYVSDGCIVNEGDMDGHSTMVAGVCEYGIIHPDAQSIPRTFLYSTKVHDGEYLGDFELCKQELYDERIEIDMEQEDLLYNFYLENVTERDLFDNMELKIRVQETRSVIKKYTRMREKLIVNRMREIVEYFCDDYRCHIFNLSRGDLNYPYNDKKPRAWTCILDELQREYDISSIVSSGSYDYTYEHDVKDILADYPKHLFTNEKARVIDPTASSTSLTVGDMTLSSIPLVTSDERISALSISQKNQISSSTRIGPGVQKAIKPEFVACGGDSALNTMLSKISPNVGNYIISLSNKLTGGLFCQGVGASLAVPYVSHIAALVLERYPHVSNNLLRAVLASASSIPKEIELQIEKLDDTEGFINCLRPSSEQNVRGQMRANKKEILHYLVGYGYPIQDTTIDSFEQRVMLLVGMKDENAIQVDKSHIFEIPIPKESEAAKGKKGITVSLAYNPDVRKARMDYLRKSMSSDLIRGKSLKEIYQVCAFQAGLDEEEEKERFESKYVCNIRNYGKTLREYGTLQKGTFGFSRPSYGEDYCLVVDCKKNWSVEKQNYALVVTYRVEDRSVKIYKLLKSRIRVS